jgi:hypothetical protein
MKTAMNFVTQKVLKLSNSSIFQKFPATTNSPRRLKLQCLPKRRLILYIRRCYPWKTKLNIEIHPRESKEEKNLFFFWNVFLQTRKERSSLFMNNCEISCRAVGMCGRIHGSEDWALWYMRVAKSPWSRSPCLAICFPDDPYLSVSPLAMRPSLRHDKAFVLHGV